MRKISEYLLNAAHPDNSGKATFFESMGFSAADPTALADALRGVAVAGDVVRSIQSIHGVKYVVDGLLETAGGKRSVVRTVWIIDRGQNDPRLVSAYPRQE